MARYSVCYDCNLQDTCSDYSSNMSSCESFIDESDDEDIYNDEDEGEYGNFNN